jgi:hypothetical protein
MHLIYPPLSRMEERDDVCTKCAVSFSALDVRRTGGLTEDGK